MTSDRDAIRVSTKSEHAATEQQRSLNMEETNVQNSEAVADVSFKIEQEREIHAGLAEVFDAILAELGPESVGQHGEPMPLVLEARPGGRWFRDLGGDDGHHWGHVQAIKRPNLVEIYGPLWMSQAVCNNVQYRLAEAGGVTTLRFVHSGLGIVDDEYKLAVADGWSRNLDRIVTRCPTGGTPCPS